VWALHVGPAPGDDAGNVFGKPGGSFLVDLTRGTADLALAVLTYPQPFLVIFLVFFGAAAWSGLRVRAADTRATGPVPDSRLVGMVIAIAVLLHWLLVPLAGATDFAERLLQPALQVLPIYLFMLVEQGSVPAHAIRPYVITLAAVAAVALAARIGIHLAGADYCRGACRTFIPFQEIAAGLRDAGFRGRGTIVVHGVQIGGNLRVRFPEARIMDTGFPSGTWPEAVGTGQCLGVWTSEGRRDQRATVDAYLTGALGVDRNAAHREGTLSAPMDGSRTRAWRLHYRLYDGPQGTCR
jgi:hypothetical protein